MEAFRNICGASLLVDGYGDYEEFNLKKFQLIHCTNSTGSNLTKFKSKDKGKDDAPSIYGKTDPLGEQVEDERGVEEDEEEDGPNEIPAESDAEKSTE